MNKFFTIVTICFNSEKTIRKTIESIISQDKSLFEYIIIDGGSKDGTTSIIKEYIHHIDLFITEPDKGISDAFNKGIRHSSGQYIWFINSDDVLESSALNNIYFHIANNKIFGGDVFYADIYYLYPGIGKYKAIANLSGIWDSMTIFHPSLFVRSEILNSVGAFSLDYRYAMDCELIHRLIKFKAKFIYIPYAPSTMLVGGISGQHYVRACLEFFKSSITHNKPTFSLLHSTVLLIFKKFILQTLRKLKW